MSFDDFQYDKINEYILDLQKEEMVRQSEEKVYEIKVD